MKVLYVEWTSYGNDDLKKAMVAEGHELVPFPLAVNSSTFEKLIDDPEVEEDLRLVLRQAVPDVVYSTDFFPVISKVCQKEGIRYISWSYDAPDMLFYSALIANPCNTIYTFDKAECRKYREMGFSHIHYLPLAVDTERLDKLDAELDGDGPSAYAISFVGSLYLAKTNYFNKIEALLPEHTRGYLKALIAVQLKIKGYDLVGELLPAIVGELEKVCPIIVQPGLIVTSEAFYEHVIIVPEITAIERIDLLETIAQHHELDLFTHGEGLSLSNVRIHGSLDYYKEMPLVFKKSKINLNITTRSIVSGTPLRAFDIMGAGGFLLSDHQADMMDHFIPDEDFVCYKDKKDLLRKIDYYLAHEEERKAIARNGYDKVVKGHTYRHRVREMLTL